jgi:copper homeostasis protein CutC
MTTRFQIEVAVETPGDASTAAAGGADRIELSAALDLGGLTPSLGLFHEVREATQLPVFVMIRPRPGDFVYDEAELRVMGRDIEAFRPLGPAGFVFGVLREDGSVDREACTQLRETCGGLPCVFHRAFDRCPQPSEALEDVIYLGFARVLTSGREPTAVAGATNIAKLREAAGGRIELLPCGRIRAANVETVVRVTGCEQVHASFGEPVPEEPGRGRRGYTVRSRVSLENLSDTRKRLDFLSNEILG